MDRPSARDRLVFALDVDDPAQATALAARLAAEVGWFKIGLRAFVRGGEPFVSSIASLGPRVFLDLKFHDIPDQVEGACRAAAELGVGLLTVHAGGGPAMLAAAVRGAKAGARGEAPGVLAVTVLTSLDDADLRAVGVSRPVEVQVPALAQLAHEAGCRGVVASPHELPILRAALPKTFGILCPGIRPAGAALGDQKRVMGPAEAIRGGADWIVVGRPIQQAPDPVAAAAAIVDAIQGA